MAMFLNWMTYRDVATLLRLRLLEHADYFRPSDYNPLFDSELAKVIARIHDPDLRRQVSELKGFDWANYIVRSLQRSGFRDDDRFRSISTRSLSNCSSALVDCLPVGSRGRHGPLERRFRRSVWNAIATLPRRPETGDDG